MIETIAQGSSLEQAIAALTAPELLAELAPIDPLAVARLKGMKVKQDLLYGDGQPLRSEEVAQLLGISRQAVDKRRSKMVFSRRLKSVKYCLVNVSSVATSKKQT